MILKINHMVETSDDPPWSEMIVIEATAGAESQKITIDVQSFDECFKKKNVPSPAQTAMGSDKSDSAPIAISTKVEHPGDSKLKALVTTLFKNGIDLMALVEKEVSEIQIESNRQECLALPWERLSARIRDNNLYLPRRIKWAANMSTTSENRVLIATSDAYRDDHTGKSLGYVANAFPLEVAQIVEAIYSSKEDAPINLTFYRHLNREMFDNIDKTDFAIIHLMMHGGIGRLGFEKAEGWKFIDWVYSDEFLKFCRTSKSKLFFLSACDSAYGEKEIANLAHLLVENQVAEFAIGFSWQMGSNISLPAFASAFYESYYRSGDIETGFRSAVKKLIRIDSKYWALPILYMGATR